MLFNVPFLLRRLLYAFAIGFLFKSPGLQLLLQIVMSQSLLIYVIKYRPYEEKLDNLIEVGNELTILLVFCMLLPLQHQASLQADTRYNIGFAIITLILLNVLTNFLYFLWCSLVKVCSKVKKPAIQVAVRMGIIQGEDSDVL
jgi:hypothetical protein